MLNFRKVYVEKVLRDDVSLSRSKE